MRKPSQTMGPRFHAELTEGTIVVTGAPRSGTTLTGSLVATLQGVDYQFEPPMIRVICALVATRELTSDAARHLLRTYATEELFVESLQGRRANLRPDDDSLILNGISWKELLARWAIPNRAAAISDWRRCPTTLAIKVPNVIDSLPLLESAFRKACVILVIRNGVDVTRSIIQKGWLTRERLATELYPHWRSEGAVRVPHWVPLEMIDRWQNAMTEAERACLMWTIQAEYLALRLRSNLERDHIVRYESLVGNPRAEFEELADRMGLATTSLSDVRLSEVHSPHNKFELESEHLQGIGADLLERFQAANQALGY